jgi:hypothetical protein
MALWGSQSESRSIAEIRAIAFVDDFLPYLRGLPVSIRAALVLREPNDSPNTGADLASVHSQHDNLASFAAWWLTRHRDQRLQ